MRIERRRLIAAGAANRPTVDSSGRQGGLCPPSPLILGVVRQEQPQDSKFCQASKNSFVGGLRILAKRLFQKFRRNSGDSIQQLTNSMRKMQTLAPWQGSPEWSFQIFRITSCSEACAGWMFSSPLMTDKSISICYLNRLRNTRSIS
jgi:hypothetical protein